MSARWLVLGLVGLLGACMTAPAPPPIPTPSGRPECTVPDAEPAAVKGYCLELFTEDGWGLHSETESELIFRKEITEDTFDFYPTKEVWLVFTEDDGATHVAGYRVSIARPGKPNESRFDPSGGQRDFDLWSEVIRHIPAGFASATK